MIYGLHGRLPYSDFSKFSLIKTGNVADDMFVQIAKKAWVLEPGLFAVPVDGATGITDVLDGTGQANFATAVVFVDRKIARDRLFNLVKRMGGYVGFRQVVINGVVIGVFDDPCVFTNAHIAIGFDGDIAVTTVGGITVARCATGDHAR